MQGNAKHPAELPSTKTCIDVRLSLNCTILVLRRPTFAYGNRKKKRRPELSGNLFFDFRPLSGIADGILKP
jgi:hypothetical protein